MKPLFTTQLLAWNVAENRRQMPWKGEPDAYRIWLSEIILQQTRVEQGLAYYNRFVARFPTVYDLANAPDQEVFKLWEGLGYYSRCKNLLATARQVSSSLNGQFPNTYEGLKALKGVGPYTAAAIASFAFGEPHAVVDGNVIRVLARYFGISTPVSDAAGKALYALVAESLLDKAKPGQYNQAIMDFGALICKPQQPLCATCVQRATCEAFNNGWVGLLPVKEKKAPKKLRWFYYLLIESEGGVYIRKRGRKDIWENLNEFYLRETDAAIHDLPASVEAELGRLPGNRQSSIVDVSRVYRQQLTHQTITGQFVHVRLDGPSPAIEGYQRIELSALRSYPFPRFITTWLEEKYAV